MAEPTGLEPATFGLTIQRSSQLNYGSTKLTGVERLERPQGKIAHGFGDRWTTNYPTRLIIYILGRRDSNPDNQIQSLMP